MNAKEIIIEIREISKIYKQGEINVVALDKINLDVPAEDFLALMGPSGSGKSTLLHIIAGIDRPTSGKAIVGGVELTGLSEAKLADWRIQYVGFIFQTFNLIPVLTAFENVELPLLLTGLNRRERIEHVEAALALVGLQDRMKHLPKQLSGGQEQRVAIARSIVTDPMILVADEPTGDLDAHAAAEILGLMTQLNEEHKKTVIMVTHDPKAALYAKRIIHLEKGSLTGEIKKDALKTL